MGFFERIGKRLEAWVDDVVPDEVRPYIDAGEEHLEAGRYDEAARTLEIAEEMRPENARILYLRGVAELRRGHLDEAVSLLSRAAGARERFVDAEVMLGQAHQELGQRPEAELAYRRALAASPRDSEVLAAIYKGLGGCHLDAGRTSKAVRELRKAAALVADPDTDGLLGRAMVADGGDLGAARVALERAATAPKPDARALVVLAEVYLRQQRAVDAERALARALELAPRDAAALSAMAELATTRGDVAGAHTLLLRAAAADPSRAEVQLLLARAQRAAQAPEAAFAAYDRAIELAGPNPALALDLVEEALGLAVATGVPAAAAAARYTARLERARPGDSLVLAGQAIGALAAGQTAEATARLERSLAARETVMARVLLGRVALAAGDARGAVQHARAALRGEPAAAVPRQLLIDALRALTGEVPRDLYGLAGWLHRQLLAQREIGAAASEVAQVLALFDRPLLLTVMGEFNSGKSTFVNSLIGEEVAPMGITPTTATVNVLGYGRTRAGRVIYRDDRVRELSWEEVPTVLRGLDAAEARKIRLVEVLVPVEELLRVSIVDTPGLNSIMPEHEEVAREFIAQADAVIWLFSTAQAGKASEREALDKIRAAGKECLGVLNKIDRAAEAEVGEVVAHLRAELGALVVDVVPYSAREALAAAKAGRGGSSGFAGRGAEGPLEDAAQAGRANRPALQKALEERFYSRARALKRAQARVRLVSVLRGALAQVALLTAEVDRDHEAAQAARRTARAEAVLFEREVLPAELRRVESEIGEAFRSAAREVLEFVRPRSWVFGEHRAAAADRDFLVELLEDVLGAVVQACRTRVLAALDRVFAAVVGPIVGGRAGDAGTRIRADAEQLLDARVVERFRAFLRGMLRGGRVDDFFVHVLPRLELSQPNIAEALARDASDFLAELAAPLRGFATDVFRELDSRAAATAAALEVRRLDLEERLVTPLESGLQVLLAEGDDRA